MTTTTVTKAIEKITKVLNENNITNNEYDIQIDETDSYHWIYIYTTYISFETLKNLKENNINVVTIWPDKHEFEYYKGTEVECVKTTVGIRK